MRSTNLAAPTTLSCMPQLAEDEYAALEQSIAEHGLLTPIVVDENGVIIDGHRDAGRRVGWSRKHIVNATCGFRALAGERSN